jgi:hypothetical protein
MTHTEHVRREQVSVQELRRRLEAEQPGRSPEAERIERRVRVALDGGRPRSGDDVVRWLAVAAGVVAVLTALVLVSLVSDGQAADEPVLPDVSLRPATSVDATSTGAQLPAAGKPVVSATMARKVTVLPPSSTIVSSAVVPGPWRFPPNWYAYPSYAVPGPRPGSPVR